MALPTTASFSSTTRSSLARPGNSRAIGIRVDPAFYVDFDFESHRHVCAGEILRLHEVAYPVRTSSDPLQNLQRQADSCFARSVFPNEQGRRMARDRQLEIFQTAKVMNIQTANHGRMIVCA